jgi:inner membrane protein
MHRQFSHSLIFIPLGGLIVSLILWIFYRRYPFRWIYLAATLGYGTHALLDAFTSYGTLLFWPWTDRRIFWDILPILDPLFTFLLFLGFIFSLRRHSAKPALAGLLAVTLFTLVAAYQHHRGLDLQRHLVQSRGHILTRERVMPTVGNLLVWRSLYESSGRFYADALRLPPWGKENFWEGESKKKLNREEIHPKIPPGSRLDRDLNRFQWFADDYLIWMDRDLGVVGDVRFGSGVADLQPFWGIRADFSAPQKAVQKIRFRFSPGKALEELGEMIWGSWPGHEPRDI